MSRPPEMIRACDLGDDGGPTCATGPFGRLAWTVRELARLVRQRPAEPPGEDHHDAR